MRIETGQAPINGMTYLAILSVCLIIDLPGIAIAPVEGKLLNILHAPELEVQLLTTLPNFVIIPFVLLAGRLTDYRHKIPLIALSLFVFMGCGISFLFINSMEGLIIASCLLGAADGILIPFAMGFMVNTFQGKYRTRHLGVKSATSNFGSVAATFIISFIINEADWHLPFSVYIVAVVPLCLCFWLKNVPGFGSVPLPAVDKPAENIDTICRKDIDSKKIWSLIFNNVWFSIVTFAIVIYLPQLIEQYGWNPRLSAYLNAVFFMAVLTSGFFLVPFVRSFKSLVFPVIGLSLTIGLCLIFFIHARWAMYAGSILAGLAFGIFQPLIYDKTSYAINNPAKNIFGLSLVLCALYIAIAAEPFMISGVCHLFRLTDVNHFAFNISIYLGIAYIITSFIFRKKFIFGIEDTYYS